MFKLRIFSDKRLFIVTGAILLIFLTVIAIPVTLLVLEKTNQQLKKTANDYQLKTGLILSLWDSARARESTLQKMFFTEDSFVLDDLKMHHFELGSKYQNKIEVLKGGGLKEDEEKVLLELKSLTIVSANMQLLIRQLIIDGNKAKAKQISTGNKYTKARENVFIKFKDVFYLYRDKTRAALHQANETILNDVKLTLVVSASVLFICVMIIFYMLKKISASELNLKDEITLRAIDKNKLEKYKDVLEKNVQRGIEKYINTEKEHRKSEIIAAAYGEILENALNEIYIYDIKTLSFYMVNAGARHNLGYSKNELNLLTPLSIMPGLTENEFREILSPLLNGTKKTIILTSINKRKDGSTYPIESHLQQAMLGEKVVFVSMVIDITDRKEWLQRLNKKKSENEIINQELEFQKYALDEHAIVSSTDVKGTITYANDKFCEISGYDRKALIGKSHNLIKSGIHSDKFYRDLWRTVASGKVWKGEICNKKKDGSLYWLAATIVPFLDDKGKPHKYIAIRFDITDQKNNEKKLIARNEEIEKTHKELDASQHMLLHSEKLASVGQLAAGIAHEINTPIQFIGDNTRFLKDAFEDLIGLVKVYGQLTQSVVDNEINNELAEKASELSEQVEVDYLSEEVPKAIVQTLDGVQRVSKIVGSMKDFSHPGSDSLENIDLNKCIESTINVSHNEWKYCAEMVTYFDASLTSVACFPGELNQVILNIIVNASHAIQDAQKDTSALGTITIVTKTIGDNVEISIKDSGCGMSEEVQQRIFEPFYTTKGVGKGTGQGLAIAYAVIVDKHHGAISVKSEPGNGTTFVISLPVNGYMENNVNNVDEFDRKSGVM